MGPEDECPVGTRQRVSLPGMYATPPDHAHFHPSFGQRQRAPDVPAFVTHRRRPSLWRVVLYRFEAPVCRLGHGQPRMLGRISRSSPRRSGLRRPVASSPRARACYLPLNQALMGGADSGSCPRILGYAGVVVSRHRPTGHPSARRPRPWKRIAQLTQGPAARGSAAASRG